VVVKKIGVYSYVSYKVIVIDNRNAEFFPGGSSFDCITSDYITSKNSLIVKSSNKLVVRVCLIVSSQNLFCIPLLV